MVNKDAAFERRKDEARLSNQNKNLILLDYNETVDHKSFQPRFATICFEDKKKHN